MATKFYLHAATTAVAGTLPSGAASVSTQSPTKIASGTNRSMDGTIGTSQTSIALTTNAVTTAQPSLIGRWVSPPLNGVTGLDLTSPGLPLVTMAGNESNTNSNFNGAWELVVWRPSTGAVVLHIASFSQSGASWPWTSTTETSKQGAVGGGTDATTVDWLDGDVFILEAWRNSTVQGMSTAYTNTIFFDGTTEGSSTSSASLLTFNQTIGLFTPPNPDPIRQPGSGPRKAAAQIAAAIRARGF